jgi:hypothetical protein
MSALLVLWVASATAWSADDDRQGCDTASKEKYQQYLRLADSLRPDKPGQMRVFAANGAEFTAGQAQWIRAELSHVEVACKRGQQAQVNRLLSAVQELFEAHARGR